ncbi:MAG: DUF503 domain-containing protein [Candidatus Promineifilaceae bacterium]
MQIASCTITLQLYGVHSLKGKRRILKSILARLPKQFNIAAAEIAQNDTWQTAVIALVTVGNDPGYLHGLLEKAVAWLEENRPDAVIEQYNIEFR